MVRVRAMAVFVIAFGCYACGGSTASPPATSSNPSASAAPASTASSGAAEFGVPECDDYLKKYEACIDKLAPAAKDAARQAIDQSRAAWKQAAATEQGKAALATTCKAASDAAAPGLRAQGCAW